MSTGRLTTHVLDLSRGEPAAGMAVSLWKHEAGGAAKHCVQSIVLNGDGRSDNPLISGESFTAGAYELLFEVQNYYAARAQSEGLADRSTLFTRVPVFVEVKDHTAHYHIPLIISPGGYSTYRGT
ncbi:hydroxyisourate hydrolase [Paenibacillus sp. GCM10023252]|uniref:hydroxyisourate hydrolase n=1 Tax=Paenibacillus sp. GCM10023252 TaxID=3252649 RepID=UPI00360C8218